MAEATIYGIGVTLIVAGIATLYYLRGASKDYLEERKRATHEAIKKLVALTSDTKEFFDGYETIHEEYTAASENAEAYRRLATGFVASGLATIGFNFLWTALTQIFGQSIALLFALLIGAAIWTTYLRGLWTGIQEVHRIRSKRFVFRHAREPTQEAKLSAE